MMVDDVRPHPETYLGDAVYASFDGYQIWLRTADGNNQCIALDSNTYAALVAYAARLQESTNAR